jgi:pimeloyl-ACP methyl ester carboxylesterase
MPIVVIPRALLSLLSLLILYAACYLIWSWYLGVNVTDAAGAVRHVRGSEWRLYTGLALLSWSFLGRFAVLSLMPSKPTEPREERSSGNQVTSPDGSILEVERFGLIDGPTLILTHGWGLNSTAWWRTKQALSERFRLVTWDLPGLGRSKAPKDGRLTIDRFAESLGAVVGATDGQVVLVGHSIGGMTTQTFWRACPEVLRARIAGIVLVDTTYENPINTMVLSSLWRALRWPLIEPMMWLMIVLSPLVWLSNWQSYLSGSSQLGMRLTGFGRFASRGEVDFSARLAAKGSPAIQAKGNLAMFRWSIAETLPMIDVPVLILTGSRDIVTLPSASDTIGGMIPNARVARIEGCGHMGFMERAEEYDREIANFADRVLRAPT